MELNTQGKQLDYAELLRDKLVSLKERLEYLDATVIASPDLIEGMKTCIDYAFYLKDETITQYEPLVMADSTDAEFIAGRVISVDEWNDIKLEIEQNDLLWNKVNTALKKAVNDVIV